MPEYYQCTKCGDVLELNDENFHRREIGRTGYRGQCKKCIKAKDKKRYLKHREAELERGRLYRLKHPDKIRDGKKRWNERNKKRIALVNRKWIADNREHYNEKHRSYCKKNRDNISYSDRKRKREKRKTDINYRIKMNLYRRMNLAIRKSKAEKLFHHVELLGCSIFEFKTYIALKFTEGMSWENYGKWHIDHIIPCCAFDLTDPQEQLKCFHHTNLQPLWAEDNLKKGDKIIKQESILG
jgi:hypothetical protein